MVAAMTPAERFAERRKRRQKPWLAKLEPVRPGPVGRYPSLTRYPGPKPPRSPAAEQMDTAAVEFEEFLSRSASQLVTSVGWPPRPTLGLTQRPGQRQSRPLCVTTSRAGPEPAQSIIGPNGVAFPLPRSRLAPDGVVMADLPHVIGLLHRADWTRLSLSAELRSENDRELSRLSS